MSELLTGLVSRALDDADLDCLEDWTTVRKFATATEETIHVARLLLDGWAQAGEIDRHDDGVTGVKYRRFPPTTRATLRAMRQDV